MSENRPCQDCGGEGTTKHTTTRRTTCTTCHGLGRLPASWPETADVICYTCNGSGEESSHETEVRVCRACNGVGFIREVPEKSS